MPLVKATLQAALASAYNQAKASPMSESDFATLISDAIDAYNKTATVTGTATGALAGGPGVPVVGTLL
jgi:flagellar hook-basal body complex protein FliE